MELFAAIHRCLSVCDPDSKCEAVFALHAGQTAYRSDHDADLLPIGEPGRPGRPVLVHPAEVHRRRLGTGQGRAALIHAIAHIEFNAINLALDAAYRFRGLPADYYRDWLSVASDEARHFGLLQHRLQQMGYTYGDFSAHNGLWEMAQQTAHDGMVRMALVPRVLEARGLDVTPGMIERLQAAGDAETVAILEVILQEEVRHVEIGSRWFRWHCRQRGLEPEATFIRLLREYYRGRIKGPFNEPARLLGGFTDRELAALAAI